jgi:hypothetical protein
LQSYSHPAAILIGLIFNGKQIEMMLNLNELFAQTVFKRIKASADAQVSLTQAPSSAQTPSAGHDLSYISIKEADGREKRLIPRWIKLKKHDLKTHRKEINGAFECIKNEGLDECYLLYPKQENFTRHIELFDHEEHKVKLVPYSFTFTNKEAKRRA